MSSLLWADLHPLTMHMVKSYPTPLAVSQNVTTVTPDVISLEELKLEQGGPLTNVTGIIIKRENLDTEMYTERPPCEDEGKDRVIQQSEAMPKMASKPPETQTVARSRRTLRVPGRS